MKFPWEIVSYLQNFFQLQFLFSGLEVSSSVVFAARVAVFLVFGAGLLWIVFRLVMKILDCIQTLLASLAPVPKTFYLLLFLAIPLSSDSIGARWMGYILLVMGLMGLGLVSILVLVLWKYGVEQTVRFINTIRARGREHPKEGLGSPMGPDTALRPVRDAPVVRTETGPQT